MIEFLSDGLHPFLVLIDRLIVDAIIRRGHQ
jgi:hypothetical protein